MTEQFTEEFEQCRSHLRSYLLQMIASTEDTDDLVQKTEKVTYGGIDTVTD